jgi:Uma2 family endonuclease
MATVAPALAEIEYPSSDGEPMAETPIHRDVMLDQITMLKAHFADEPDVYVSGNMMMYYVEGNADKCVSPDVFVTRGIPKLPERDTYKLWVEGKGPDAVIEVTSKSTARVDQRWKFALYRDVLKVREYFLFDPREKTLAGVSLCGYRLTDGQYELIPKTEGRLVSEVLGLHLEVLDGELRLYDPQRGAYLLTPEETRQELERQVAARAAAEVQAHRDREALEREATARTAAEDQAQREATARTTAEDQAQREAAARAAAEDQAQRETAARAAAEDQAQREAAARAAAEKEVERLRRELEALRGGAPPGP